MLTRFFTIALLAGGLAACSTVQNLPLIPGGNDVEEIDPLSVQVYDWRVVGNDILVIRIPSNGCTEKSDLLVDVRQRSGEYQVTVERRREDYCRAIVPNGVEIPFGFEELGARPGANVRVMNARID